jgi:hypothetical protein
MARPVGRPTDFNQKTVEKILFDLADGRTLTEICTDEAMPHRVTVYQWLDKYEEFRYAFQRARENQQHSFSDELVRRARDESRDNPVRTIVKEGPRGTETITQTTSDNTAVQRDKLVCDNLYRLMTSIASGTYSTKQNIEHSGSIEVLSNVFKKTS